MQAVEIQAIYRALSEQRLKRYQKRGIDTIEIYSWNMALSESLYPLLHLIEIAVRNRLHVEIGKLLNDPLWLTHRNKIILDKLGAHWLRKIDEYTKLLSKKGRLDEGHLISELTFGFWTTLLSGPFEYKQFLWPKLKNSVFPYAPGLQINHIRERFDRIRKLRNRVFHYGSIWHKKDISLQHNLVIEAIKWIEPALLHLIEIDRFNKIYIRLQGLEEITRMDREYEYFS